MGGHIHSTPMSRAGICRRARTCPEAGQGAMQRCAGGGRTDGPPLPGQRLVGRAHGGAGRSTGVCRPGGDHAQRATGAATRRSPHGAPAPVPGVPCRFQRTVLTAQKVGLRLRFQPDSPGPGSVLMGRLFRPRCTDPGGPSAAIPEAVLQPVVGWRPCRPARQPGLPYRLRLLAGGAVVRPPFQPISEGARPAGDSASLPGIRSAAPPCSTAAAGLPLPTRLALNRGFRLSCRPMPRRLGHSAHSTGTPTPAGSPSSVLRPALGPAARA